jgi:hypothetical protein
MWGHVLEQEMAKEMVCEWDKVMEPMSVMKWARVMVCLLELEMALRWAKEMVVLAPWLAQVSV